MVIFLLCIFYHFLNFLNRKERAGNTFRTCSNGKHHIQWVGPVISCRVRLPSPSASFKAKKQPWALLVWNKVLGSVAHTRISLGLPSETSFRCLRKQTCAQRTHRTAKRQHLGSGVGEGQGDLSTLRRDATQKRGYGTGHEKPLSWSTEDRQDLPRTTYSEGSPGKGTIIDKGKDTGQPSLFSWSGGYVKGSNRRWRGKWEWR